MPEHATKLEVKNLDQPDETRCPPKSHLQVARVGEHTIMRATFEPGWKWSDCIKPTAGTETCMSQHVL
ncbi:MAG: cupin, partial [Armatimonadetes bacterium]|nr:cupin [Armatimonadota bacterium]